MDTATAKSKLLHHPEEFLRYYPVQCAGAQAPLQNDVNLRQYNISKKETNQIGGKVGHCGATRSGFLGTTLNISSFFLQPDLMGNSAPINNAHVVPMVNYNDPNNTQPNVPNLHGNIGAMHHYKLDGQGRGLMVTGQLSNCCFCWLAQGIDLWCIHVQPGNTISAIALQNWLATGGRFAGRNTPLLTYGRTDYPTGHASVIGVRRAGQWHLYAQRSDDVFDTISGAYSIYPGAVRRL
jgi:hypothetical protein